MEIRVGTDHRGTCVSRTVRDGDLSIANSTNSGITITNEVIKREQRIHSSGISFISV